MMSLTHPLILLGLFIAGLIVGSFLNVVIYRLPRMMQHQWQQQCEALLATESATDQNEESETTFNLALPHSHCPHCKTPIKPWHNIPLLGWLLLRGRCVSCQQKISPRYPLVELAAGVLTVICALYFPVWLPFLATLGVSYALLCLTLIDAEHQLLPDVITLPLLWAGLLFNALAPTPFAVLPDAVLGAAAGYGVLWLLYHSHRALTGKEGMGYGDFKLTAAAGAWLGWQALPLLLLLSAGVGAVIGLVMLRRAKAGQNTPIAFGPYLAAAFWISLIWGEVLREKYLLLFTL